MPRSPYDLSSSRNLEALKRALRPEHKDYPASPYDLSKRKSKRSLRRCTCAFLVRDPACPEHGGDKP